MTVCRSNRCQVLGQFLIWLPSPLVIFKIGGWQPSQLRILLTDMSDGGYSAQSLHSEEVTGSSSSAVLSGLSGRRRNWHKWISTVIAPTCMVQFGNRTDRATPLSILLFREAGFFYTYSCIHQEMAVRKGFGRPITMVNKLPWWRCEAPGKTEAVTSSQNDDILTLIGLKEWISLVKWVFSLWSAHFQGLSERPPCGVFISSRLFALQFATAISASQRLRVLLFL